MANLATLSSATFETEVLKSDRPVLVDFSAEWCGPCRQLAPVIEDLAKEYDGRVKFFAVDVDQAQDIAMQYGIASVPTVMLFKDGRVVSQMVGARPRPDFVRMIEAALGS